MSGVKVFRYGGAAASIVVISTCWCRNKAGICLQFAVPIEVMDINEIVDYGTEFMRTVKKSYGDLIRDNFMMKTESPIVCSSIGGDTIMMWCFQGVDDKPTKDALKKSGIKEIKYDE